MRLSYITLLLDAPLGGYIFFYDGSAVSWKSKKQNIVALSSTEAEYISVTEAANELLWI